MTFAREETAQRSDVPALRKGMTVLEAIAATGSLSMAEVQRRAGLNKTMTFRILRLLVEMGYVDHDPDARRYSLGLRLLELGAATNGRLDIVTASQPSLAELRDAFDETVNLGVLVGRRIVYVAMLESRQGLRMSARVGNHDPLHSTSLGKAILAFLPERTRDDLLRASMPLARLTPKTIVDLTSLRADLEATRARGYAIDDEENETGALCIGAPILDCHGAPIAGVSISGPVSRMDHGKVDLVSERLMSACSEITRRMERPAMAPVRG